MLRPLDIYAVMDLKDGQVVQAVAGQRADYRPITSRLTDDPSPFAVARAFAGHPALRGLYVADLDAISGSPPDFDSLAAIAATGMEMLVDAGTGNAERAAAMAQACFDRHSLPAIVVGLESVVSLSHLSDILGAIGSQRAVFSLDLKHGKPWSERLRLQRVDPLEIAATAWQAGFRRILVLDVAAVGMSGGPVTVPLCRRLSEQFDWSQMISGGGVRGLPDLQTLADAGCHAALVASALHQGTL